MFLSNARVPVFVLTLTMPLMIACGDTSRTAQNNTAANAGSAKSERPFASKEPEVYQATAVYSSGGIVDSYFIARNRSKRRLDTYVNDRVTATELIIDNTRYVIDHVRKIYYADPPNDKGPKAVNPAALAFFQNTHHNEFEETARANGQITYRAKRLPGDPEQDVVLTIDEASGLIVRQEVKGKDAGDSFTFELKDLRLEAANDLFQMPAGYKQVTKDEFKPPAPNKKP